MSDHLIAEANRHASALPEDLSTVKSSVLAEDIIKALSDIAWYVRECETLRTENAALREQIEHLIGMIEKLESDLAHFATIEAFETKKEAQS